MNPFYQALGGKAQQPQQAQPQRMNPMQMIQQLRQNPAQMLQQGGFTIPDGMNNPQEIINHLLQSGQITSNRLNMVQQMAQQMMSGFKR